MFGCTHLRALSGLCRAGPENSQGKRFFLEKKNQKAFTTAPTRLRILHRPCAAPIAKVFDSFFKKRRFLSYFL
jgi:hypothetical protein